jgi:hypothetical protein
VDWWDGFIKDLKYCNDQESATTVKTDLDEAKKNRKKHRKAFVSIFISPVYIF